MPVLIVGALTLGVARADATPLSPGQTDNAAGIPFPGGTELDSVFYENASEATLVVDIASAVYESAGGTLDFYYQVSNDSEFNLVHRLTGSSFTGFLTDVWYILDGGVIACAACPDGFFQTGTQNPLTVDRDGPGEVVGFNFPTPSFEVNPGESSLVLLIRTNATEWEPGFVSVINSGASPNARSSPRERRRRRNRHRWCCSASVSSGLGPPCGANARSRRPDPSTRHSVHVGRCAPAHLPICFVARGMAADDADGNGRR